ncbi:MAG: Ig-like domain-containing protein [Pseudomonadales bacterium]|nr:Ig-like domain-containing protein [Pseudomonadales bacterium]
MNPKEGQTVRGVYNFSAEVFDPVGIKSVVFEMDNYIQLAPNGLESPLKIVDTTVTLAKDGHHHFEITATNSVDISVSKNIKFYVDNTAPNFNWSLANNSYITSGYDFNTETTDNLGLASAKLYLDGELLKDFNLNGTATSISAEYYLNPLSFSEGEHNLTYEVFDNAGGSKSVTRTVYIDYLHPQVAITSTGGGYITSSFPINFSASDTNGVKSIKVLINGANASGNLGANTTKFTVNPSSFSEGSKTIKVVVTDMAGKTSESSISKDFRHKAPSLSSPYTSGSAYSYYVKWNLSNVDANEGLSLSVVQVSCTGQKNDGYGTITRTCKKPKVTKEGSSKLTTDVITKTTEGLEGGLCNLKGVFDLKVVDPFGFTKTSRFNASYCY